MKKMLIFLVGLVFFTVTDQRILEEEAKKGRISETFYLEEDFRSQPVSETFLEEIGNFEDPGEAVGFYFLETNYGEDTFYLTDAKILTETERLTDTKKWKKRMNWWQRQRGYEDYADTCRQIWNDVQYFPVASGNGADENRITFGNSWMQERTYGGKRGHEGTDLMPKENKRGTYPIVSMTDRNRKPERMAGKRRIPSGHPCTGRSVFLLCTSGFLCESERGRSGKSRRFSGIYGRQRIWRGRYHRKVPGTFTRGNLSEPGRAGNQYQSLSGVVLSERSICEFCETSVFNNWRNTRIHDILSGGLQIADIRKERNTL